MNLYYYTSIFVSSLFLTNTFYTLPPTFNFTLPCSCDDGNTVHSDNANKIFWNDKNLNFLSESQKEEVHYLQEKINNNGRLTTQEQNSMIALKDIVFKSILGEESFNDFKMLVNKKKSGETLSKDEITRLKNYFRTVNN